MNPRKKYEKLEKIGQGSFGTVFKVRNRQTREFLVLKEIDLSSMSPKMRKDAENEVKILKHLNNKFIVRFVESFKGEGKLNIITEYCEKGDLGRYIRTQIKLVSEDIIMKIFVQVCMGLKYLHDERILHRDIKAMNIFLKKDYEIRIGDLGVAKILKDQKNFASTIIGTPYYLSPELCAELPYNEKNDIWALGCLLYEMCKQTQPFKADKSKNLKKVIKKGDYKAISPNYSDRLRDLIEIMLSKEQEQRPSIKDILLNDYVQERIEKLDKEIKEREENNKSIVSKYHKSIGMKNYAAKLYNKNKNGGRKSNNVSNNVSRESNHVEQLFKDGAKKETNPNVRLPYLKNARKSFSKKSSPFVKSISISSQNDLPYKPNINLQKNTEKEKKSNVKIMKALQKGKKISELLREQDGEGYGNSMKSYGNLETNSLIDIQVPKRGPARASHGMMDQMMKGVYGRRKSSIENNITKTNNKKRVIKSNRQSRTNLHDKAKNQTYMKEPVVNAVKKRVAVVNRKSVYNSKISLNKSKNYLKNKKTPNSYIVRNSKHNKKQFIGALEKEYKNSIQSFNVLDNKFKNIEKRKISKEKLSQDKQIEIFLNPENDLKDFHFGIVQDMDRIISQNDKMVKNLAESKRNYSAITINQKNPPTASEKRKQIKKDFGNWFSEDYFEECLKEEGELGMQGNLDAKEMSESGRERQIDNIVRDFAKKKNIEEVVDGSDSKKVHSLNVSSNERLPISFSGGYTISNKRNKFGRQVKRMLEIDNKHKRYRLNVSERDLLWVKRQPDFRSKTNSHHMKVFLRKLRWILRKEKSQNSQWGEFKERKSKSCDKLFKCGGEEQGRRRVRKQSELLRGLYLDKHLGSNKSCLAESKQSLKDESNCRADSMLREDGTQYASLSAFIFYLLFQIFLNRK